jgi:predicted Rossmann fold nucleotide-binding protein DprA/Smf involved in DNA uptake
MIITGGADGIDLLAEQYADRKRLSKLILRPRYDLYGKYAPLKRNEEMVALCDMALIVWDGTSKGTKHTISYAEKLGKKVVLITHDIGG